MIRPKLDLSGIKVYFAHEQDLLAKLQADHPDLKPVVELGQSTIYASPGQAVLYWKDDSVAGMVISQEGLASILGHMNGQGVAVDTSHPNADPRESPQPSKVLYRTNLLEVGTRGTDTILSWNRNFVSGIPIPKECLEGIAAECAAQ